MRILMMSWRDIKNPLAGGAEKVTFELLRRFVRNGHSCTWFASSFSGSNKKNFNQKNSKESMHGKKSLISNKKNSNSTIDQEKNKKSPKENFDKAPDEEIIDGVRIIRQGNRYSVYLKGYSFLKKNRNKFDLVIDQVNSIPFFTPLFYKGRKVAFFHQLAEEIWFYEMPFPFSWMGYLSEKLYVRLYRKIPTITVSDSTKRNLDRYGVRNVFAFENCIDSKPLQKVMPKKKNQLVYVGRLKKSKRVDDILRSFSIVRKKMDARLHIIGNGDQEKELKKLVAVLGHAKFVVFHGFLEKDERNRLLAESDALLMASTKEGFGLVVLEAASQGTPTITYDVDGLRDAVVSGKTGLIVKKNNPEYLAKTIVSFLGDIGLKKRLSKNALVHSRRFNWDDSAKKVMRFLGI